MITTSSHKSLHCQTMYGRIAKVRLPWRTIYPDANVLCRAHAEHDLFQARLRCCSDPNARDHLAISPERCFVGSIPNIHDLFASSNQESFRSSSSRRVDTESSLIGAWCCHRYTQLRQNHLLGRHLHSRDGGLDKAKATWISRHNGKFDVR